VTIRRFTIQLHGAVGNDVEIPDRISEEKNIFAAFKLARSTAFSEPRFVRFAEVRKQGVEFMSLAFKTFFMAAFYVVPARYTTENNTARDA